MAKLRVIVADDERPARSLLLSMLSAFADVEVVGEATNGTEAVEEIESKRPDLAFLDLQMPELDGLGVVRLLRKEQTPLIAFVTAYDQYAVKAFELNAVDYLLKPVEPARLRDAINRAQDRLEQAELRTSAVQSVHDVAEELDRARVEPLRRIPVRKREQILLVPVDQIASITADGELLHLRTLRNEHHTISYRLKDLEPRIAPIVEFVRLGRGTLVNVATIDRVTPMPGGTYVVVLTTGEQFAVSRIQSKVLRERLLKL